MARWQRGCSGSLIDLVVAERVGVPDNRSRSGRKSGEPRWMMMGMRSRERGDQGMTRSIRSSSLGMSSNMEMGKRLMDSDALGELLGEARLSRPQTVKRIWEYVKARDLQDASDKRYIICDEGLRKVFHQPRIHMFTLVPHKDEADGRMNKFLAEHFRDPDEVIYKVE